jgi:type IV pilus assembly protein PilF
VRTGAVCLAVLFLCLAPGCGPSKNEKQKSEAQAASRFRLGNRYLQEGQPRKAVQELQHAVELDSKNATYRNALGQTYFFLGELELAEKSFEKALRLNRSLSDAHHNLALVYSEQGRYEDAEEEFQAALVDPGYLTPEKVYLNWGMMLKKQGDATGAEEKIRKSVALNPRYARGHVALARLLEERDDVDGALDEYLKAYSAAPDSLELNLKLGEIYIQKGNPGQARRFLQKVLDTAAPDSSEALRAEAFLEQLSAG